MGTSTRMGIGLAVILLMGLMCSHCRVERRPSELAPDQDRTSVEPNDTSGGMKLDAKRGEASVQAQEPIEVSLKVLAEPSPEDGLVWVEPWTRVPLEVTAKGIAPQSFVDVVLKRTSGEGLACVFSSKTGNEILGLPWGVQPHDLPWTCYVEGLCSDAGGTVTYEATVMGLLSGKQRAVPSVVSLRVPAHPGWATAFHLVGGYLLLRDRTVVLPDRTLIGPDGLVTYPDGKTAKAEGAPLDLPGGVRLMPDRTVLFPIGQALRPEGNIEKIRPTDNYQPVLVSPEQVERRDSSPRAQDVNSPSAPSRGVESKGRTTRTRPPIYRRR